MNWSDVTVLITGGSGSFGRGVTDLLLRTRRPRRIVLFSHGEQRLHDARCFFGDRGGQIRYCLGDVRDRDRLGEVMPGRPRRR